MRCRSLAVIVAGFLTVSIAYAIRYGYGILLPEMLITLKISKTEAGVIYASYFLAYTLGSPVVGLLSDRYNVRVILALFTALLGLGAMLMALADSVLSASLIFTVAGLGHAACWAPVVALVQKWVPDTRRGTALAFATLGSGSGIALWSFLLPFIVAGAGWQAGWIWMGACACAVAVLNYLLVSNPPREESSGKFQGLNGGTDSPGKSAYWALFRQSALWQVGLSYALVGFTVLVPYTYLSTFAVEQLNFEYSLAARLITVIALCAIAGKVVIGILSDRLGRVPMMMVSNLLMGAGCTGMALVAGRASIYYFTALFGLGFGAVWPVYAAAAPDFFSKKNAGAVIGLWTVFLGVGSIVSPIVCGWAIDVTQTYSPAFAAGAAASAGAIVLLVPGFKSNAPDKREQG